jgi:hypothetical protein
MRVDGLASVAAWYLALLQHRSALHFKSSIMHTELSHNNLSGPGGLQIPSLSDVLNMLQSWLAPVLVVVCWTLLYAGVYTRGCYIILLLSMSSICGLRSISTIINKSFATLKRIAPIVSNKEGTRKDRDRRLGYLKTRSFAIMFESLGVFSLNVLAPVSALVAGSTFNSRQWAIHVFIYSAVQLVFMTTSLLRLCAAKNKTMRRRRTMLAKAAKEANFVPSSAPEGMSALEPSQQ